MPFHQFPPTARKVIYTTNSIGSMNSELRKATRHRVQFPTDVAVLKILRLMICTIEDRRAATRVKRGKKVAASARCLVESAKVNYWNQAIHQLAVAYPERFEPYW